MVDCSGNIGVLERGTSRGYLDMDRHMAFSSESELGLSARRMGYVRGSAQSIQSIQKYARSAQDCSER